MDGHDLVPVVVGIDHDEPRPAEVLEHDGGVDAVGAEDEVAPADVADRDLGRARRPSELDHRPGEVRAPARRSVPIGDARGALERRPRPPAADEPQRGMRNLLAESVSSWRGLSGERRQEPPHWIFECLDGHGGPFHLDGARERAEQSQRCCLVRGSPVATCHLLGCPLWPRDAP